LAAEIFKSNLNFSLFDLFAWWFLTPLSTIFQLCRGENNRPVASHRQTLSHNVVHLALIEIQTHNISGERH
jgi:hypothetical protein